MDFSSCLALQLRLREAVIAGHDETVLLVEHPPTLTLGRRGSADDVLWTREELAARGVAVCETPRGGQVTLHAPGQLVAYPVLRIGTRVRAHVQRIGEVAASQVRAWGVAEAQFRMEHPGVWLGARKLASIGVHVSRGVTVQGIAINLAVDPALFSALVSCGLPEGPMANVADFVADVPDVEAAGRDYAAALAGDLQRPLRWIDRAQIVDPPPV